MTPEPTDNLAAPPAEEPATFAVPPFDAVPVRITLPPDLRPPWASPTGPPTGRPGSLGWPSGTLPPSPSGLFPSGPPRPTYREPHPIRGLAVAIGAGAGALWMLLFGLVSTSARGYVWWTVSAGIAGWLSALVLARLGDRGVAVGVAVSTGVGVAIAGAVVAARFIGGHWLPW